MQKVIAKSNNYIIFDAILNDDIIFHNHLYYNNCYLSDRDKLGYKYITYYRDFNIIKGDFKTIKVCDKIAKLEEVNDLNLIYLFIINNGRFKNFDTISLLDNGMIQVSNSLNNKKIQIKVGRFIRSLLDDNKEFIISNNLFDFDRINSSFLEKISDEFLKIANNEKTNFLIYKGEDILKGYTRSNYYIEYNSSSLSRSCMSDKHQYLELYTKNLNVELGVIYHLGKVVARCLIWNTISGTKYYDIVYHNFSWAYYTLIEELKKIEIKSTNDSFDTLKVKLDFIPEYFPYLDSLCYLNTDNKVLSNDSWSIWDKRLEDGEGGYIPYIDEDEDEYED